MSTEQLPVIEIFGPTIQGEGPNSGVITHFIRFAGCSYRCTWCDTPEAVIPSEIVKYRKFMDIHEIILALHKLGPAPWITFTGGDPCLHDLHDLISLIKHTFPKAKIAVETQGAKEASWLAKCDHVVISPKPPSSGEVTDYVALHKVITRVGPGHVALKIAVFTDEDLKYVKGIRARLPFHPLTIQVGTVRDNPDSDEPVDIQSNILTAYEHIVEECLKDKTFTDIKPGDGEIRLLPQLHTLIWGTERGK